MVVVIITSRLQITLDKGDLKSSAKVEAVMKGDKIVGSVTYKMSYATYVHEGKRADGSHVIRNYKEPGSGKKFLERKFLMFPNRYIMIIVRKIRRLAGY